MKPPKVIVSNQQNANSKQEEFETYYIEDESEFLYYEVFTESQSLNLLGNTPKSGNSKNNLNDRDNQNNDNQNNDNSSDPSPQMTRKDAQPDLFAYDSLPDSSEGTTSAPVTAPPVKDSRQIFKEPNRKSRLAKVLVRVLPGKRIPQTGDVQRSRFSGGAAGVVTEVTADTATVLVADPTAARNKAESNQGSIESQFINAVNADNQRIGSEIKTLLNRQLDGDAETQLRRDFKEKAKPGQFIVVRDDPKDSSSNPMMVAYFKRQDGAIETIPGIGSRNDLIGDSESFAKELMQQTKIEEDTKREVIYDTIPGEKKVAYLEKHGQPGDYLAVDAQGATAIYTVIKDGRKREVISGIIPLEPKDVTAALILETRFALQANYIKISTASVDGDAIEQLTRSMDKLYSDGELKAGHFIVTFDPLDTLNPYKVTVFLGYGNVPEFFTRQYSIVDATGQSVFDITEQIKNENNKLVITPVPVNYGASGLSGMEIGKREAIQSQTNKLVIYTRDNNVPTLDSDLRNRLLAGEEGQFAIIKQSVGFIILIRMTQDDGSPIVRQFPQTNFNTDSLTLEQIKEIGKNIGLDLTPLEPSE